MSKENEHWDNFYRNPSRSWTDNNLIQSAITQRMTGGKFWLNWLFEDYLGHVERVLCIGCGDGAHEIMIAQNKYAQTIDAFDGSAVGIARARTNAAEQLNEGAGRINFKCMTFDAFCQIWDETQKYDLILFSGSLHHVTNLEAMLSKVRMLLSPSGKLVFNEYVGDCYNIYPQTRVDLINRILLSIGPTYLNDSLPFENPTIEMVMNSDPSEAVRSQLILPFLGHYFDFQLIKHFGGSLLHPIYPKLNAWKLDDGSPESIAIIKLLIQMEDELICCGELPNDFAFGVCTHKQVKSV